MISELFTVYLNMYTHVHVCMYHVCTYIYNITNTYDIYYVLCEASCMYVCTHTTYIHVCEVHMCTYIHTYILLVYIHTYRYIHVYTHDIHVYLYTCSM